MNKTLLIALVTIVMGVIFTLLSLTKVSAAVNLPWTTTFDCVDWEQGQPLSCDGFTQWGDWTCNGDKTAITGDANYSGGYGGRGARFYAGDGVNVNSCGLRVVFNSLQPEIWVRWYMRYEVGFQWSPLVYDKWLYFDAGTNHSVVAQWYGSDEVNIWSCAEGNHMSADNKGWSSTMGGLTSDGQWHFYEVHLKMDTNGSNGIGEIWVDGVRSLLATDIYYGTVGGWDCFHFYSNQRIPNNGRNMYVDFDDVAVSNTGYIGPIPIFLKGDFNNDGVINIQDVQLCVNVILGTETNSEIISKAQSITEPNDICNELDMQIIINIILRE